MLAIEMPIERIGKAAAKAAQSRYDVRSMASGLPEEIVFENR
jgi:hypothetical protein